MTFSLTIHQDRALTVTDRLLDLLHVRVTKATVREALRTHPDYQVYYWLFSY